MRKFFSNTIAALANFIEFDEAVQIDANDPAHAAERQRLIEGYARAWAIDGDHRTTPRQELSAAHALVKERRMERKLAERRRQQERSAKREAKEMRLAY